MPALPIARILIVDDEAAQMRALCNTLLDEGYETEGCAAGTEALAAMGERPFDLLLTDLTMPGMDGIELLRAAQELDHQLVAVVMTGHGTIDTAVEAMKAGAVDYILKPFKLSAALPVLSRALAMRRLRVENAELVRRVQERTVALETANKDLDAFASSVAHDLHAPARHISGYAQILQEECVGELSETAQRSLRTIASAAERMSQLIADLLAFSRLTRMEMQRSPVSLEEVVSQVRLELEPEMKGRDILWKIETLPTAEGDRPMLRQVFCNLLSNAVKFTRRREQAIIEVGCKEQPGELICFVRDNGAGFDMRYAGKLFGVFKRLHSNEEFEGTGIGLSIVQRIIQRHGGRIWAEAEVNKGATFYFALPTLQPS